MIRYMQCGFFFSLCTTGMNTDPSGKGEKTQYRSYRNQINQQIIALHFFLNNLQYYQGNAVAVLLMILPHLPLQSVKSRALPKLMQLYKKTCLLTSRNTRSEMCTTGTYSKQCNVVDCVRGNSKAFHT